MSSLLYHLKDLIKYSFTQKKSDDTTCLTISCLPIKKLLSLLNKEAALKFTFKYNDNSNCSTPMSEDSQAGNSRQVYWLPTLFKHILLPALSSSEQYKVTSVTDTTIATDLHRFPF